MNKQYKDFVEKIKDVVGPSNEDAHGPEHLTDVVNHSLDFLYNYVIPDGDNVNETSVRLAAALHDIGMKIGRDYHETWGKAILDGKLDLETVIMSSKNTTKTFTKADRIDIANGELSSNEKKTDAFIDAVVAKYKFEAIYNGTSISDFIKNEVDTLNISDELKNEISEELKNIKEKDRTYNPALKELTKMFDALFPNVLDNGERSLIVEAVFDHNKDNECIGYDEKGNSLVETYKHNSVLSRIVFDADKDEFFYSADARTKNYSHHFIDKTIKNFISKIDNYQNDEKELTFNMSQNPSLRYVYYEMIESLLDVQDTFGENDLEKLKTEMFNFAKRPIVIGILKDGKEVSPGILKDDRSVAEIIDEMFQKVSDDGIDKEMDLEKFKSYLKDIWDESPEIIDAIKSFDDLFDYADKLDAQRDALLTVITLNVKEQHTLRYDPEYGTDVDSRLDEYYKDNYVKTYYRDNFTKPCNDIDAISQSIKDMDDNKDNCSQVAVQRENFDELMAVRNPAEENEKWYHKMTALNACDRWISEAKDVLMDMGIELFSRIDDAIRNTPIMEKFAPEAEPALG